MSTNTRCQVGQQAVKRAGGEGNSSPPIFTLETWVIVRVYLDENTIEDLICKNYAAASLAACEAFKAGAVKVEMRLK